jgi:hypothetical protein
VDGLVLLVLRKALNWSICHFSDELSLVCLTEHLVMMLEYLLWETLKDPWML